MNPLIQAGHHGAFVSDGFGMLPARPATTSTSLQHVRLAVKDVFEVAGLTYAAGNPQWGAAQVPARGNALCVQQLLQAGCQWVGKTVTDELTYSLAGINAHYGTPQNPRAPLRLPGGSSSGSAVAVSAGDADLALGTDCGGSIRLPASYCGLWGIRPSHGLISANGCFTLSHSLDTVGWFARDGELLQRAFHRLCHSQTSTPVTLRWLVSDDVLEQLDAPLRVAFEDWLTTLPYMPQRIPAGSMPLEHWAQAFRTLQASEIWQHHGAWVEEQHPVLGADIAARFAMARQITAAQVSAAQQVRSQASSALSALLGEDACLLLPPVPGIAPLLADDAQALQDTRTRSQRLLCMAGLAGLPQVVMPWLTLQGAPVGLSLMGQRFTDEQLLNNALQLHAQFISSVNGKP